MSLLGHYSWTWQPPRTEILKRIWAQFVADDCIDLAAQMSFYFILSLFPFFIFLAALVGYLPFTGLWDKILTWMTYYLPWESRRFMLQAIQSLTRNRTSFLSFGLVASAWSATSGFVSLMESLSIAHEVKDTRSFLRKRAVAFLTLVVVSIAFISAFALLTVGSWAGRWMAAQTNHSYSFHLVLEVVRWAISLLLMVVGVSVIDYALPCGHRRWRWMTPGSILVVGMLVLGSLGFNVYVQKFAAYDKMYGTLGAFVVLMVWIYITSLILLIGAETDSALENLENEEAGV